MVVNQLPGKIKEDISNNPALANKLTSGDWPGINVQPGVPDFEEVCDIYVVTIQQKELSCPESGNKYRIDDMSKPAMRGFDKPTVFV